MCSPVVRSKDNNPIDSANVHPEVLKGFGAHATTAADAVVEQQVAIWSEHRRSER